MPMRIAKYQKIKEFLKREALKPESVVSMPSIRELMVRFNVAASTVNQALGELEHEHVIMRHQGRGLVAVREPGVWEVQSSGVRRGSIFLAYPDFPSEMLHHKVYTVEQYAKQCGLGVVQYHFSRGTPVSQIILAAQRHPRCQALVLIPAMARLTDRELGALGKLPHPVVLLDTSFHYDSLPGNLYLITHNPVDAAQMLSEYLLSNGHCRIGLIRNESQTDYGMELFKELSGRFQAGGATVRIFSKAVHSWDNPSSAAREITGDNLDAIRADGLTALFYISASGAYASIPLLVNEGIRIPEDISLISEGNLSWLEYSNPPLTVINPEYGQMCMRAVEIADGHHLDEQVFYSDLSIIIRDSVRNLGR